MAAPQPTDRTLLAPDYQGYLRLSALVEERCGLHFPEKRRADLERGVRRAFAASTCADLDEYCRLLQDPTDGAMRMEQLINALTVGETHFFRDAAQFDALYADVLPQIIERRRPIRSLRIWSAGCASGEEPYSIAMVLRELLPDVDEWAIVIMGTDINTEALDRARKALYSNWAFREERAKLWRPRYFRRRGDRYELIPAVRQMVSLAQLNLVRDDYPAYETNTTCVDLILCRNVMMYFTEPVTRRIVEQFYHSLAHGGWLVVGHAEHSLVTYQRYERHSFRDSIVYRRADGLSLQPEDWAWPPFPRRKDNEVLPIAPLSVPEPPQAPVDVPAASELPDAQVVEEPSLEGDPVELARERLEYGRSERARELLMEVVKQRPGHAPTCALLGQACANLGRWEEAEDWCRQALELDKLALDAYYTLALVLQHQGRLDEAIGAMKKVVYVDRRHVLGHFGLAELYHSSSQLAQALKSLDNAGRLLGSRADTELVADTGGITVAVLREAIVRQQQRWSAERDT